MDVFEFSGDGFKGRQKKVGECLGCWFVQRQMKHNEQCVFCWRVCALCVVFCSSKRLVDCNFVWNVLRTQVS